MPTIPRAVRPRRRSRALLLGAIAVGAGASMLAPGCGSAPTDTPAREPPATRAEVGIEARLWTIDATLGPFLVGLGTDALGETGLPAADRSAWRDAGIRLIEVDAGRVDGLETDAPHAEAVRRIWLGQPTRWTAVASRDASEAERRTIPGAAGSTLQMLVRSWIEPDVRRGPVFRVELALARVFRDGATDRRPELVRGMLLSHTLEPGRALLLVPASPGEIWADLAVGEEPGAPRDPEPGPLPDDERDGGDGGGEGAGDPGRAGVAPLRAPPGEVVATDPAESAGPVAPAFEPGPTVGESLLLRPARLGGWSALPARRTVVAIVPNWPARPSP